MPDECDMAQDMEATYRRMALQNAGCAVTARESRPFCEECGEPIPAPRRRAVPGVRLCVDCQEEADARDR
ncbi:TraR/DksA C4-type zinc finger protein [Pseudodesulfovibrio sp.]|uniref:TraR/DksA C4-type zinc finger protein n=1 Tax=unclassified Pseudodesulfovibrio TaxID=2661612 RepID=UPI003B00A86F